MEPSAQYPFRKSNLVIVTKRYAKADVTILV